MNQTTDMSPQQKRVVEGLAKAVLTLRSTMSTVNKGGVSVTVTAEPKIIQVKLPSDVTSTSETEKNLCDALNEAIKANAEKIQSLLKP